MTRTYRQLPGLLAGAVLTVGLTALLLRPVGPRSVLGVFGDLQWPTALPFVPISLIASGARAAVYHLVLGGRVGVFGLVPLMWLRALAVDFVPARLGLAAIPLALRVVWGIETSSGFGALAGVTVAEFASLGALVLLAASASPSTTGGLHSALIILGFLLVASLPVAISASRYAQRLRGRGRIRTACADIALSVSELSRRSLLTQVIMWSFTTRLAKYAGLYLLLRAMPVPPLQPLAFLGAALAAEATTTLPVQGLAGIGTWEAAWVAATTGLGFSMHDAVLSAFGLHLLVLGWEILLGSAGLAILMGIGRHHP
ncbi:MAG: flippase-like domain-containing protein [Candidatus Eisenbacteria bacterium]|nr:flippase-like domain-containing protein [Candidatus Eisenbacteria bacterium]